MFLIAADLLLHCNMLDTTWAAAVAAHSTQVITTRPTAAASIVYTQVLSRLRIIATVHVRVMYGYVKSTAWLCDSIRVKDEYTFEWTSNGLPIIC